MTPWIGIILGAMAFAGTAFAGSTGDYTGLLGCFSPPDESVVELAAANDAPGHRERGPHQDARANEIVHDLCEA
jgi:hypothetical protein